jgi:hypothetical protein
MASARHHPGLRAAAGERQRDERPAQVVNADGLPGGVADEKLRALCLHARALQVGAEGLRFERGRITHGRPSSPSFAYSARMPWRTTSEIDTPLESATAFNMRFSSSLILIVTGVSLGAGMWSFRC